MAAAASSTSSGPAASLPELVDPVDVFKAVRSAVERCQAGRADHLRIGELVNPSFHFERHATHTTEALARVSNYGASGQTALEDLKRLHRRSRRLVKQGGGKRELDEAWKELRDSSRFAHHGPVQDRWSGHEFDLTVTDADGKQHMFPLDKELDVEALLAHCSPSPYGDLRSKTTRLDPSVRLAMELRSKETASPDEGKPSFEIRSRSTEYRRDIVQLASYAASLASSWLFMDYRKIRAVPQKLNVYGPGGHFKLHVDTPVGDRAAMLGTVLVALPSKFTGGTLVVHPPGLHATGAPDEGQAPVEWGFADAIDLVDFDLRAVAFYGDCPHEVQEVTSGHRVTVSFAIYEDQGGAAGGKATADESASASASSAPEDPVAASTALRAKKQAESCARLVSWVRNIVNPSPQTSADGKSKAPVEPQPLGLILSHGYTITALDDDSKAASNLKGSDALLYRALVEAASVEGEAGLGGASVQVLPVVVAEKETYDHSDDPHRIHSLIASTKVFRFTQGDLLRVVNGRAYDAAPFLVKRTGASAGAGTEGSATGAAAAADEAASAFPMPVDIPFVVYRKESDVVSMEKREQYGHYTGNEGDPSIFDDVYFAGALVVIPPGYDGKRPAGEDEEEDDDERNFKLRRRRDYW